MADPAIPTPPPADRARNQGLRDPSIDQLPEERPRTEPDPDLPRPSPGHRPIDDLELPEPDDPEP